jgi:short-subunit dehydrogenase
MLTETLQAGLQNIKSKIHASVVCPGLIATNIGQCETHRPRELQRPQSARLTMEDLLADGEKVPKNLVRSIMPAQECAEIIFHEAIQEEKFYVLPNATMPIVQDAIRKRMDNLLKQKSPEPSLPSWETYGAAQKKG